ncbi:MAG: LapA family protein [Pseudomonadota bacterium]|jgi:putative membrane protein|uniref:LapA family protein n=1 Tax=Aquabacterium sp. TaxID=1872578 RepID=UPI003BAF6977
MRALTWLWRAFLFFVLFAFALKNQHVVDVRGFFGYSWQAPMVFVMLGVFGLGCAAGVVAMVPSWWRHRRDARKRLHLIAEQAPAAEDTPAAPDTSGALPSQLPHPPDMPAPRKQGR